MRQSERCECGVALPFENATRAEYQTPCPSCGSTIRIFDLAFQDVLPMGDRIRAKAKCAGSKPFYELFSGADWSGRLQKFMEKTRTIDRKSDQYSEVVEDPDTGAVIHRCSEPLSEHVDHGSARKP